MANKCRAFLVILVVIIAFLAGKWLRFTGYFKPGRVTAFDDLKTEYDYIIVGGGSAGSVVASRLSEKPGISVLLLEAGGEETDSPTYLIPGFAFMHVFTSIDWMYQIVKPDKAHPSREPGHEEIWNSGKVLGGGSIINYLNYGRGSKHDFNAWEKEGCTGWGYKDVLPYFKKSEDVQSKSLNGSKYHGNGGFLGVSEFRDPYLTDDFLAAGRDMGYKNIDASSEDNIGFSPFYWTVKNGVRSSPSIDLLRDAMVRENLHVSVRSFVNKVVIENKQAVGVEFEKNGKKVIVKAKREVILSAGGLASPKLLMLSGIGPKADLTKLKIPMVADLPVGENMRYHLVIPVWATTNSTDLEFTMPNPIEMLKHLFFYTGPLASAVITGGAYLRGDGKMDGPPDYQIHFLRAKLPSAIAGLKDIEFIDSTPGFSFVFFDLHPKSVGVMKLKSSNASEPAVFDPKYFSNEGDIEATIKGIRLIQKFANTPTMKKHQLSLELSNIPQCKHEKFDSDKYWDCYIRNTMGGVHQVGTCKMGDLKDPATVVGPDLKVKGVKGLRVVDSSIIPMISGILNAPCIMIGEKGADMILKDLK